MPRLSKRPSGGGPDDAYETRRTAAEQRLTPTRAVQPAQESPSPSSSFSSDKENRASARAREKSAAASTASSARRGVLVDRTTPRAVRTRDAQPEMQDEAEQPAEEEGEESVLDTRVYDPEQDMSQRRDTRKTMRDLTRELLDSRNEYLARDSTGLKDSILKANRYFDTVKQTSDATLDSRFLVSAGDTAARRAVRMNFGGAARGIDVGEFAVKCRTFMLRGPRDESALSFLPPSQRAALLSSNPQSAEADDGDGDDDGDELNWAWLGLRAAAPSSRRPATPNFLLGPLAVQKRARAATQRSQRARPRDPADAARPDELRAGDAGAKAESASLTAQCRRVFKQLLAFQRGARQEYAAWAADQQTSPPDAGDAAAKMDALRLRADGGVCLVHFAFNPLSFGQTVENLFYISFLIRDGKAGLNEAGGVPSLHPTDATDPDAPGGAKKPARRQAVFHLDFDSWRGACEAFGVAQCIIGHRDDESFDVGPSGWYG